MSTLAEYIASQDNLVQEASLALPHQFSQCTYPLGPLRQAVYLCLTCPEARGVCAACSIACHTEHEQIELCAVCFYTTLFSLFNILRFPKRKFRCDCPTEAIEYPCSLHSTSEPINETNRYGQNFQALFCRCQKPYDAGTEKETMIQCLACEDWFHESCCNLREKPPIDTPPENKDQKELDEPSEDVTSEASTDLPPPLIGPDDYDAFVCGSCVLKIPILQKYAGTFGCLMVIRDEPDSSWKTYQGKSSSPVVDASESSTVSAGNKRSLSPTATHPITLKKPRLSPPSPSNQCLAPEPNTAARKVITDLISTDTISFSIGAGDLFLTEGFRDRWCRCSSCIPELEAYPYLLTEEETYELEDDPDSGLSLEELGMRALAKLPRERAIDGIHAFNSMRDDLVKYLRPFAQEGKVVKEADVRGFFDNMLEEKKAARA
ncbi:hypothetical protein BDP27DRAFT_1385048 [Rhodocollybia butyracea]|uniref:Zinc finger PHD-type domain-containing protein n=1 Tax=Rhodocollybia butyracea TaxID=206335 RepID=A0A9P5U0W5_9AGAR|nr:hypothetical protein BDP27DRAFT_1385048 [Rhodocollybia butyracea]